MTAAKTLLATAFIMTVAPLSADINIGGNVYGGGNEGEVNDGTHVTVRGGNISGDVFGGGRMANVDGGTRVTLDGANATSDIFIRKVFGGNDISGTVTGTASGDALVESTYSAASGDAHRIWVDELYGGGNGDYDYASNIVDGEETNPYYGKTAPEIESTRISLLSGCYGKVFGGGNKATVTGSTTISLNNSTATLKNRAGETLDYQFGSVFGGNNLVEMAIRPTWDLQKGSIDNLYSGGNKGAMTHPEGILLAVRSADMTVNNMFGGCRMADVNPAKNTFSAETFYDVEFPANFAARVLVTAGKINNVYGGNDVSGNVYGGNALEISSSIINDIYGGGNGSYAYTDLTTASGDADYYYDPSTATTSAEALYYHRPNAESVNLHIVGTEASPTYVGGSLYCGGNSATLYKDGTDDATVNLNIGSYVVAKNVFLGSNGANMVTESILQKYADNNFSSLDLTDSDTFEEYMRGCEVSIKPTVNFDSDYSEYSTKFESLFCGGNVGSMSASGYFNLDFLKTLVIYQKLVGGCNNANVAESTYNAEHEGGLITHDDTKVILNIAGVQFDPKTITYTDGAFATTVSKESADADALYVGGNIYGGCYQSGYIDGGVQINISQDAVEPAVRSALGTIETENSQLNKHLDAVFNTALSAFGGGYGEETEIRGNTEINLTSSANIVKVFGGGEMGVVIGNTAINLQSGNSDAIYGGGFEGLVKGNATVNLDGGTTHFAFAGACNADIEGYAEMLIGVKGEPTVSDELFGGNDFGGQILGTGVHDAYGTDKVKSNTYVLYKNGTVAGGIYGGSYGSYDYTTTPYLTKATADGFSFPSFTTPVADDGTADIYSNSYVDIYTTTTAAVAGGNIYGGGYGYLNIKGNSALETADLGTNGDQLPIVDMNDTYVLLRSGNTESNVAPEILGGGYYSTVYNTRVDVRSGLTENIYGGTYGATTASGDANRMDPAVNYRSTETTVNVYSGTAKNMNVFGGGANAGSVTTNVNLYGGTVNNVYGGSNMEGVVETANVTVPSGSTSVSRAIFGGGFGANDDLPCDVLTANVNWASETAYVSDSIIYGGNNSKRATKITNVNISKPVMTSATGTYASICGGGNGENTITGYSHVNLLDGAQVKNVYGGGRNGQVYGYYNNKDGATAYYDENGTTYPRNVYAHWAFTAASDNDTWNKVSTAPNTSIVINTGATAQNIYGAGWGKKATVSGNTYVQLNGGTVTEDIFGGGYAGNVYAQAGTPANLADNLYTYVDIDAGSVRNVYGGGYNGNVGNETLTAETRVGIGESGDPAILRSVYGGGYKGAVIGTAKTRMWDGHVGYYMNGASYVENLNYEGSTDNLLKENGNVFGGGFGEGATVDHTDVELYDGTIRNSLYGGGEIAAIGRGSVNADKVSATITQAGSTLIHMYGGLVSGDVFGGGRGYAIDAYGNTATGEIGYSDGYTFGTTAVYLHRGTIGTESTVFNGQGNVFGGGNIGYVYTATGKKSETDGYYYSNGLLTEDCKVVVAPVCMVKAEDTVEATFAVGEQVPEELIEALASGDARRDHIDNGTVKDESVTFELKYNRGNQVTEAVYNALAANDKSKIDVYGIVTAENGTTIDGTIYAKGDKVPGDKIESASGDAIMVYRTVKAEGNISIGSEYAKDEQIPDMIYNSLASGDARLANIGKAKVVNAADGINVVYIYNQNETVPDEILGHLASGDAQRDQIDETGKVTGESVNITVKYPQNYRITDEILNRLASGDAQRDMIAEINVVTSEEPVSFKDEYAKGTYVPLEKLNTLSAADPAWDMMDELGITIGNAVFAGGNVSAGSDRVYANAKTVFGNATASVTDVFNKDFISIGNDGIGGLYGDGNLTFVDGYRELNITNYGTDYYNLTSELSYREYLELNDRERAYFELQYSNKEAVKYEDFYDSKSNHTYNNVTYKTGQIITATQYAAITDDAEKAKWTHHDSKEYNANTKLSETDWALFPEDWQDDWELLGFCTLYAGRMINTIQRADFCGVFGSRICLRGAQDRVTNVADYTNYTINRVKEVSLNQVGTGENAHGNYFGIYNVVNYLGALTSDVDFQTGVRETGNTDPGYKKDGEYGTTTGTGTWSGWKQEHLNDRKRNNGTSKNQVALASGVWLEIVDESTENNEKDEDGNRIKTYGPITGVVELDLLNVATGEGGGYVYAQNVHGVRSNTNAIQVTLSEANRGAVSKKQFTYVAAKSGDKMQTSGNFVHSTKRIVDDCYPQNGAYYGTGAAPAHYWYVRGEYYVYDQYISAYTGSAQAYAKTVSIPLTITAEAQGRLKLESVDDNYYAYWDGEPSNEYKSRTTANAILVNGVTYVKNDPISYWDWNKLTTEEQAMFKKVTYVCSEDVKYGSTTYKAGDVILPDVYDDLPTTIYICTQDFIEKGNSYTKGQELTEAQYNALENNQDNCKTVKAFFNITNAVSHDNGFLLTFDWDNPEIWDDYYHQEAGTGVKMKSHYKNESGYILSPTFRVDNGKGGVYGQLSYSVGDLIEKAVYDAQASVTAALSNDQKTCQATFEVAYIAKNNCEFTVGSDDYNYVKGAPVAKSVWDKFGSYQSNFEPGYICTETYQMSESEMIINGETLTDTEYDNLKTTYSLSDAALAELRGKLSPVYICSDDGNWGGNVFVEGHNYEAVKYGNLPSRERVNFHYNYDAFDLLSEDFQAAGDDLVHYQGETGNNANGGTAVVSQIPYAITQSIDYTATYDEDAPLDAMQNIDVTRSGEPQTTQTIKKGDVLINTEYEKLTNEQACYTALNIPGSDGGDKVYYVVNTPFQVSDTYYNIGKIITDEVKGNLTDPSKVTPVTKNTLPGWNEIGRNTSKTYYFCTKEYTAQTPLPAITGLHEAIASGDAVPVGTIIEAGNESGQYGSLTNLQKGFIIDGKVPTATSTLYVARETDIRDLSQDKIVTVTYWYDYVESDESGTNYETIRERHIVNVHVHFESGVPSIGELLPPSTVLPGTKVGLNQPAVSKGAYEILGGGWEMYTNQTDAQGHKNGVPYVNNNTRMYWYQDGYYVAYYAKSYLGKTYSNPVQFSVANYHKMGEVMSSKHNETTASGDAVPVNDYMYIDEAVKADKRKPKIYIGSDDELNDFAAFFTLTTASGDAVLASGDAVLAHVADAANLEFFLHDDIAHDGTWTPVGTDDHCFAGTFHGDGHTISGLDHSLFGNLCNDVYNLGVTGSFTGGGIADTGTGYAENCWIATTVTPAEGTMAIIGNPTRNNESGSNVQIVNCYYPETNSGYSTTAIDGNNHGVATMKPVRAFVNGEVAYDLNGFYLTKRYYDANPSGNEYSYWIMNDDRTDKNAEVQTGHYPDGTNDYVENYYSDGDFRYSDGIIPMKQNIREKNLQEFFPVWPDDYIFFGQTLTFDAAHDNSPAAIVKHVAEDENDADMRLIDLEKTGNRVFRAPAYYRSKTMDVAHFNSNAVFNATYAVPAGLYESKARTYDAYKGMTAIDFTESGDGTWALGEDNGIFNRKVTDYIGLTGFKTNGITQNLLAYIPAADNTYNVVSKYFNEPVLEIGSKYSNVAKVTDVSSVHGHAVVLNDDSYLAPENHFLVDKQDFNAPIAYQFNKNLRMWYQREPSGFVQNIDGGAWETIVLPFTATLVSAHQKGELTHFYGNSSIGHEYWLRGFSSMGTDTDSKPVALFSRPAEGNTVYEYKNHFLWDTYYSELGADSNAGPDKNSDLYQTYYNKDITYTNYGYLTEGVPYIVAFPDSFFYEFDMSGKFVPHYTAGGATYPTIEKQTVSYLSALEAKIGVTDDMDGKLTTTNGDYNFRGTFLNGKIATESYTLNAAGDAFEYKAVASGDAVPFRAYFDVTASASSSPKRGTRADAILIGNREIDNIGDPDLMNGGNGLKITSDNMTIYIESSLGETVILNVTSAAGKLIKVVPVLPGTKVAVPVNNRGIYLVNRTKVAVVK